MPFFGGGGGAGGGGGSDAWLIDIDAYARASNLNWSTINPAAVLHHGDLRSTGAQGAERSWTVTIPAGTWNLELVHRKGSAAGIISVYLDGTKVGEIDGYDAASFINDQLSTLANINVAESGKKVLKFAMETKNASSTNYYGYLQHLRLVRTA